MIGAFNPIDYAENWHAVVLAGVVTPGKAVVSGFKRVTEWDVKVGKGTKGATETVKGLPPAKGTIKFYAWTAEHFEDWDELLPLLKHDPTKKTKNAIQIYHAALADIDVDSVNVESISIWEDEGGGLYSRVVELLEYAPPPAASAVATPKGADAASSDPKTAAGTQPDPAIAALQKQAASLVGDAQKAYNP